MIFYTAKCYCTCPPRDKSKASSAQRFGSAAAAGLLPNYRTFLAKHAYVRAVASVLFYQHANTRNTNQRTIPPALRNKPIPRLNHTHRQRIFLTIKRGAVASGEMSQQVSRDSIDGPGRLEPESVAIPPIISPR